MNAHIAGSSRIPALGWMRAYERSWLKADIVAGLTTGAIVIPKAMAYATIAGLPLQVGLYTAFLPMVVYALLGTSRMLSVSTTTTIAILGASALGELATTNPGTNPDHRDRHARGPRRRDPARRARAAPRASWPTSSPIRCSPGSRPASAS